MRLHTDRYVPPHPPKLLQKNFDVNYETSGRIDGKQTGESNVPGDVSSRVRRSGSLTEEQLGEADEDGLLGICSRMRLPEPRLHIWTVPLQLSQQGV